MLPKGQRSYLTRLAASHAFASRERHAWWGQASFSGDAGLVVSRQDARSIAGLPMVTFAETEESESPVPVCGNLDWPDITRPVTGHGVEER